jgi:hypothetical protein
MKLKADLRNLIDDQPTTILTAAVTATGTTLTVASNDGLANSDYLLLGKLGDEKTEIVKINGAVSAGTSLATTACVYSHDEDTPVVKLDFNQVRFYHGTTNVDTSSTALAAAQAIDPTEIYNYYNDSTYTTGYGFVRFYNATTTGYSDYSDAIPYTGYTDKMLRRIRDKVRRLINETDEQNSPIDNGEIDDEINLAQKEIAHDRLWSFYEKIKSFSTVANQYKYSLASDVFVVYDSVFDTQPLAPIDTHRFQILRWDSDTSGDPTHIAMWRREAYLYPYPSSSANTTTVGGSGFSASATTITVASTSGFDPQGRILIGSEVISYTGTTSTTFTGCVRGEEGTTAASMSNGDTVTKRDVIYHFQEEPEDLSDETDSTSIPEPSVIAYRASAELALNLEKQDLHDRLICKYERGMAQLRKVDEPKIKSSFGRVKSITQVITDSCILRNPNDYPHDIS